MDLIKDILSNSTFPQNELEKICNRNQYLLEGQIKDPQAIAIKRITKISQSIS